MKAPKVEINSFTTNATLVTLTINVFASIAFLVAFFIAIESKFFSLMSPSNNNQYAGLIVLPVLAILIPICLLNLASIILSAFTLRSWAKQAYKNFHVLKGKTWRLSKFNETWFHFYCTPFYVRKIVKRIAQESNHSYAPNYMFYLWYISDAISWLPYVIALVIFPSSFDDSYNYANVQIRGYHFWDVMIALIIFSSIALIISAIIEKSLVLETDKSQHQRASE